ncbi:hypothetical protein B9Z19DRAFT_1121700 [Tuber borchii]|uniref:Conserved oligomeric Golgi complex subunit 4 N-terminal domain-containing protein n=1 Tax=Tuber borchii TaxID=42251 RepID=A0A2T7A232_TUBBO|nr:hypothetical protein B9Z19DRAFT_1121700 [Tuber borchii]
MLSAAATAAQRVSSAVKCLDIEQFRIRETLEVVAEAAELKTGMLKFRIFIPSHWSAAESVYGLCLQEFEHVAEAAEGETVTRFFKLFPLIGRTNVVSQVCGCYVCHCVAARASDTLAAKRQAAADGASGLGQFFNLTDTESYGFSFLVQSYMPSTRGLLGGSPVSGSLVPGSAAHRNSEDAKC